MNNAFTKSCIENNKLGVTSLLALFETYVELRFVTTLVCEQVSTVKMALIYLSIIFFFCYPRQIGPTIARSKVEHTLGPFIVTVTIHFGVN